MKITILYYTDDEPYTHAIKFECPDDKKSVLDAKLILTETKKIDGRETVKEKKATVINYQKCTPQKTPSLS